MEIKIRFKVEGHLTQKIQILNGDSPEVFEEKMISGEYITSLDGHGVFKETTEGGLLIKIGNIIDVVNETELDDFELITE